MKHYSTFLLALLVAAFSGCAHSIDAKAANVAVAGGSAWAGHDDYLQALKDRARITWNRTVAAENLRPPAGTTVTVAVWLYSDGSAPVLIRVEGGGGKSRRACSESLTSQHPEPWSPAMVDALGTSQRVTFTFVYP